jgi:hypothetical protein
MKPWASFSPLSDWVRSEHRVENRTAGLMSRLHAGYAAESHQRGPFRTASFVPQDKPASDPVVPNATAPSPLTGDSAL